jgi:chromosome partitioning protein
MATIIAIENTKGGAGKSTTVSNLARGLQLQKSKVIIIDRDPLRVIRRWREISDHKDYPLVVGIDTPTIHTDIKQIINDFDYIIIDGSAVYEVMAASSVKAADIVIIPVQPSGADIWGCEPLISLIKGRQEATGKPIARFLINREKKRTRLAREILDGLKGLDVPALNARISDNVLYTDCLTKGTSVFDVRGKRADLLKEEVNQLIAEIKELRT